MTEIGGRANEIARLGCMRLRLSTGFIGLFCITLLCGNALRIIPIQFLFGTVNAGEVVLYGAEILIFPLYWRKLVRIPLLNLTLLTVFTSAFIGLLKWGYEPTAILYAVRLFMQVTGAAMVGIILFELFDSDVLGLCTATCKLYCYLSVAALLMLIVFPDSTLLWAALGDSGVIFNGDPHSGRLVSTYFDPNFFSAIIALPLSLAIGAYLRTRRLMLLFYALVMLVADVMTFSRSGLVLFVLMMTCLSFGSIDLQNVRTKAFKLLIALLFLALLLTAVAAIFPDVTDRLLSRFSSVSSDDSALARLDSFRIGMDLIAEEPMGGFGYNYGNQPTVVANGRGLDSSLQMLFLNFGLFVSTLTVFMCAVWFVNTGRIIAKQAANDVKFGWRYLTLYFLLSVFWASNFNQLIFYVWWLMPVLSGLFYYDSYRRGKKAGSTRLSVGMTGSAIRES